jgi:hypothetical protein
MSKQDSWKDRRYPIGTSMNPSSYEDMKIGSIITAYSKGFHKLVSIIRRSMFEDGNEIEMNPTIEYSSYSSFNGKLVKNPRIDSCDSSFCMLASNYIKKRFLEMEEEKKSLMDFAVNHIKEPIVF